MNLAVSRNYKLLLATHLVFPHFVIILCSRILESLFTFGVCHAARRRLYPHIRPPLTFGVYYAAPKHRHSHLRLCSNLQGEHPQCPRPFTTPEDWTHLKSRNSLASSNRPPENDTVIADALVYAIEVPTTSHKHCATHLMAVGVGLDGALAKRWQSAVYT
jgi:hypothetical protein